MSSEQGVRAITRFHSKLRGKITSELRAEVRIKVKREMVQACRKPKREI